jgi:sporulation protein YlmC with PRC-barrel domain
MRMGAQTTLSDDQRSEFLRLTRSADSVELKLTIPDAQRLATMQALDMDPLDAQIRQVFFFDTPDLALDRQGVVVRARRVQAVGDDSVVKLRPVVPDELSPELRASPNFGVEVDAMPGGFVCSASLKAKLPEPHVKAAASGGKPLRKLFTKEQRAFFAAQGCPVEIDDLAVLGPITVFKLKFRPKALDRKMVAELWNYPDGSRIVELSTKCAPGEAFQVAAETRIFLFERGVELTGEQQTKTRTALEYYSNELQGGNR